MEKLTMNFKAYCAEGTYAKNIDCNENESYRLLVVDTPLEDDHVWRFCIEVGELDGSAYTIPAVLSEEEEEKIKKEIKLLLVR